MGGMVTEANTKQKNRFYMPRDVLPRYTDHEVCMGEVTYDTAERFWEEGFGTVRCRPALLKIVSLDEDPHADSNVLKEVWSLWRCFTMQWLCCRRSTQLQSHIPATMSSDVHFSSAQHLSPHCDAVS
jgi:hypothetical protein